MLNLLKSFILSYVTCASFSRYTRTATTASEVQENYQNSRCLRSSKAPSYFLKDVLGCPTAFPGNLIDSSWHWNSSQATQVVIWEWIWDSCFNHWDFIALFWTHGCHVFCGKGRENRNPRMTLSPLNIQNTQVPENSASFLDWNKNKNNCTWLMR